MIVRSIAIQWIAIVSAECDFQYRRAYSNLDYLSGYCGFSRIQTVALLPHAARLLRCPIDVSIDFGEMAGYSFSTMLAWVHASSPCVIVMPHRTKQ